MANALKALLNSGRTAVNGWLAIPSGFSAEVIAQCGWDSVTVDMQHGVQDYQSTVACFQAMQGHPVTPLVRVPWSEPGIVGKVLDAGALGVIAPMINTRHDAEAFVAHAKYPPAGKRSNGPIRAAMHGEAGAYQATANETCMVIPMIETAEAVENLEAILDVPGIDMIYVGPSDLGFSMGLPPVMDREEKQVLDIYERLVRETSRRGIHAGIHNATPAYAARMAGMGFRFVTISSDSGLMAQAARAAVRDLRAALP